MSEEIIASNVQRWSTYSLVRVWIREPEAGFSLFGGQSDKGVLTIDKQIDGALGRKAGAHQGPLSR